MLKIFFRWPKWRITSPISRPRIGEHFGDGAQAEIQSVVRALLDRDEFLESIDRSQHAANALIALGGNARIVRMTGGADLVLVADGDHPIEKISDSLPGQLLGDVTGPCEGFLPVSPLRFATCCKKRRHDRASNASAERPAGSCCT